jgi:hypothetical protein
LGALANEYFAVLNNHPVYLLYAALLEYSGPVVIATKTMMDREGGGRGLPTPCFFCLDKSFFKVLEHLKYKHHVETNLLFVQERLKIGAMTIGQFRSHLVCRAWFRKVNFAAWWLQRGVLIPHRRSNTLKDTENTTFCSFCCVLIHKASWEVHCATCIPILSMQDKPTLRGNRLFLWQM